MANVPVHQHDTVLKSLILTVFEDHLSLCFGGKFGVLLKGDACNLLDCRCKYLTTVACFFQAGEFASEHVEKFIRITHIGIQHDKTGSAKIIEVERIKSEKSTGYRKVT